MRALQPLKALRQFQSDKLTRILCIIPTMGPGGAERTMSYLLGRMAAECAVTLLTFENRDAVSFYSLPKSVEYVKAGKLGGSGLQRAFRILSRPHCIRRLAKAIRPDAIISFTDTTNITALLACAKLGIPTIISERIDPSQHNIGWLRNVLRDRTYPLANLIVVPSRRVAEYFPASLQSKIRIIGNPIATPDLAAQPSLPSEDGRSRIIAVGRYEPQKGFDRLIDAFALIANAYPQWDLRIVGEGSQRLALEEQVRRADLQDRIGLAGLVPDVLQELAGSQVMAFPSHYEGFPNALAEGLAAGLPAVAFKDVSGVEDLIVDDETGLLVEPSDGVAGLATTLSRLLSDPSLRNKLGTAARDHVKQWAPDRIFALWRELLSEAAAPQRAVGSGSLA
jgi:GalNAc-alpha-(1->4)-GalNAc-alpha-(1->3)-diNAcBac-PP-undecaprenol alpha-1,4-N-acetyl-D-galactosaminyltransferase